MKSFILATAMLIGALVAPTTASAADPCNHNGTGQCRVVYAAIGSFVCDPVAVRDESGPIGYGSADSAAGRAAAMSCIEQYGMTRGEMYFGSRRADGSDVGFSKSLADVQILRVERVR